MGSLLILTGRGEPAVGGGVLLDTARWGRQPALELLPPPLCARADTI